MPPDRALFGDLELLVLCEFELSFCLVPRDEYVKTFESSAVRASSGEFVPRDGAASGHSFTWRR